MESAAVTQEKIKAKLVADFMLNDILSNLEDVERADGGIQAFLSLITISEPLKSMMLSFLRKCRKNKASVRNSSSFTKRILLFCLAHYVFLGDITDYELRLMKDKVLPLEAFLARLQDVNIAFGEDILKADSFSEKLYSLSLHTVKQHVLMLLKKSQYSIAGKFIEKQKFIKSNHRLVLENMIKHCLMKPDLLEKILKMKDHSYLGYYILVARFIRGLNQRLDGTLLEEFGENFMHREAHTQANSFTDVEEEQAEHGLSESNDRDGDMEHQAPESTVDEMSFSERSGGDGNGVDNESDNVLSPKISLSYRLKKSHSGIIIPCKHIVRHCRKLTTEDDGDANEGFFRMPANPAKKTTNPSANMVKLKHKTRTALPKRRVLGDRFESSSVATSNLDRSYSCKRKTLFTLEMDSYITEGCLQFGVGNWTYILKSFPFPRDCTNMKIKDRFRVLIKKNFIAVLDDGDISVLDKALKAKLAIAKQHMIPLKKLKSQRQPFDQSKSSRDLAGKKSPRKMLRRRITSLEHLEDSSSPHDESVKEVSKRFTSLEDAYLVCGAMHLGFRWDAILEYMNFRNNITVDDMQKRWDSLIDEKAIEIVDGTVEVHDSQLHQRCEDVAKQLKNKILSRRKMYHQPHSSEESLVSEDESVSKPKQRKRQIVESEDESVSVHQHPASSPAKSAQLNKSIDAGTQTSKPKILLGNRSPGTLEASSSGSGSTSEPGSIQLPGGSPIRPSMINLFKSKRSPRKNKTSPKLKGMRQKRQRELARIQRRDQTVQKRQWTDAETSTFLEMLSKHGPGKWSKMLDDGYDVLKERTPVMIKDKYRNLLQKGLLPSDVMKKWDIQRPDRT